MQRMPELSRSRGKEVPELGEFEDAVVLRIFGEMPDVHA